MKYYVTLSSSSPREVIAPGLSVFVLTLTGPTFSLLLSLLLSLRQLSLHQPLDCRLACPVPGPVTAAGQTRLQGSTVTRHSNKVAEQIKVNNDDILSRTDWFLADIWVSQPTPVFTEESLNSTRVLSPFILAGVDWLRRFCHRSLEILIVLWRRLDRDDPPVEVGTVGDWHLSQQGHIGLSLRVELQCFVLI